MLAAYVFVQQHQPVVRDRDQLAFIARFYKPGKARSSYHLYLSALDGTRRRELAFSKAPWRVSWLGKDKLAVLSDDGVYVGSPSNWHPKLVPSTKDLTFVDSRDRTNPPGVPQLVQGDEVASMTINPKSLAIESYSEKAGPKQLEPGEDEKYSVTEPNGGQLSLQVGEPIVYPGSDKGDAAEFLFRRGWESPRRGQMEPHRLFLLASDHNSTNGDINALLLLEKSKKPRFIFSNANGFDFWEARSTFAYCTPRDTSPLNPKDKNSKLVWTSELHVGDWQKGTDRILISGAVHSISVAIRP
jgi:hypothetical protein